MKKIQRLLIATLALPVLQIQGSSMEPTLNDEEIVVLIKTSNLKKGQLCCFSYQNKCHKSIRLQRDWGVYAS